MSKVVGIGFKDVGKIYWFNPEPFKLRVGNMVVVETVRGLELGKVVEDIKEVDPEQLEHKLKDIIRPATEKDILNFINNEEKSEIAFNRVKSIIKETSLDMKVVGCEYTLDSTKLLIYYNADGRVDFRELVKVLAAEFKVRIELRQIGQREGAKFLGGIGSCGREICCKKHLREFDLVTMKMAKDQGMALSSTKIAGLCGKLMCCIGYEASIYSEARKRLPQAGDIVSTPTCSSCKVISVDYLREIIKTADGDSFDEWEASKVKKVKEFKKKEEDIDLDTEDFNGIDS